MASAVIGRIHTIGPGPAQYNDRPVSTEGLRGAIKTEITCLSSTTQITITTRIRTGLRVMLFSDILGVLCCDHVNAAFCWLLVCVTIRYHSLSLCNWPTVCWSFLLGLMYIRLCTWYFSSFSLWVYLFLFFLFVGLLMLFFIILYLFFLSESRAFCWWGRCNGLRSIIMWNHLLSVWGILKTTLYHPMGRPGKRASCQVTIPGLTNNYQVVVSEDSKCTHVLVVD